MADIKSNLLISQFVRPIPKNQAYLERLREELALIEQFKFEPVFMQVMEILHLTKDIHHIVRGSAGSSLVCYLLGITHIDPIKESISLARFMNKYRHDIPDIDIDFPYNRRDEVLARVKNVFGDRLARISNHIYFRESSALREAVRRHGYRQFLPKYFDIRKIFPHNHQEVLATAKQLEGTFKGYSLHCGGVVIFDKAVKKNLLLKAGQIKYDKYDVEDKKLIKIDLLCNRGLAQLLDVSERPLEEYPEYDKATAELFSRGDVLGVTFAESPAMKRVVQAIRPRSRRELALCLALVRPAAASRGRKFTFLQKWQQHRKKTQIVFDDDAIWLISKLTGLCEGKADFYRRAFAKNNQIEMRRFRDLINHMPNAAKYLEDLSMMRHYSFCKSHAISYSYLVWALAYCKVHEPKAFWHAALKHCHSMYAPWVHMAEAKKSGLRLATTGPNWHRDGDTLYDPKRTPFLFHDGYAEYKKFGYWLSDRFMPGCTYFKDGNNILINGLIATYRRYSGGEKPTTFVTVGTRDGQYWDLVLNGDFRLHSCDIISVQGQIKQFFNSIYVEVNKVISLKSLRKDWHIAATGEIDDTAMMSLLIQRRAQYA